jgi:LemA protein
LLFIVIAILAYGISIYNRLIKQKNHVGEGWSGIETQLKRRANLIPNLVETVKGYATHERDALEAVTSLRNQTMSIKDIGERGQKEGELTAALGRLFAVAEAYPDLKANENFIGLQDDWN